MKARKKKLMTPLERATEAYFESMTPEELKAERELEDAIAGAPKGIDFGAEEWRPTIYLWDISFLVGIKE